MLSKTWSLLAPWLSLFAQKVWRMSFECCSSDRERLSRVRENFRRGLSRDEGAVMVAALAVWVGEMMRTRRDMIAHFREHISEPRQLPKLCYICCVYSTSSRYIVTSTQQDFWGNVVWLSINHLNSTGICHLHLLSFKKRDWWSCTQMKAYMVIYSIDYTCEDGCFLVYSNWMTIRNPDLLSSSGTGVNPGIRSWKSTCLIELDVRKPLVVSISQKSEELRLYNLV
jgi:hypothetical protein